MSYKYSGAKQEAVDVITGKGQALMGRALQMYSPECDPNRHTGSSL